jgi:hypothetical protein
MVALFAHVGSASAAEEYAVESASATLSSTQAGAHADLTINFKLTESEAGAPFATTRDITVALPPGMIGNPQNFPRCTPVQFGTATEASECPQDSQVGMTQITLGGVLNGNFTEPIYNVVPAGEDVVARLGFYAALYPVFINVRVDPIDYGLTASIEGAPAAAELISASTTLWGLPAAESHDVFRLTPQEANEKNGPPQGRKSGLPEAPFLSNPTSCTTQRQISVTATSYQLPSAPSTLSAPFPAITGCGKLSFEPKLTVTPTNPEASAPTGVDADLQVPQDETPQGRATSALKSANVLLPPGLTINPAAGDGLAACSGAEVGFETTAPPDCPDAAKIGSAEIDVPALERVLRGAVYQRTPEPGHLFRFWLVTDELGVRLKLPAEIVADPVTGQLRTIFIGLAALGGNPQVPVADLKLHVFGGPRAPLSTPSTCGTYQTHYEFAPWSGRPATVGDTPMLITSGCGKGGFSPGLSAGTLNPAAGRYSTFVLQLTRQDGEANPQVLEVTLPKGLLAKLGGVPLCPDPLALSGACAAPTRVGTVAAAAGVGGAPLWIPQPGKSPTAVYLAGPYKGAPYSVVTVVPAQAGPFDLGTVITRAGIYVDPETAVATIKSDPLPQILEGVPVAYRAIRVEVDRPEFTLNPTNCNALAVKAKVLASNGATATPSYGFQAANCAKLPFVPKLALKLKGGTKRNQNPALTATLTARAGDANIGAAQVSLPHSEFLDQGHIKTICTRVQFTAGQCPPGAIYGKARAVSPLLDQPLQGPVYLRSSSHNLPDLVADLNGQIHVVISGRIDSVKGGIRTTIEAVPDAPVTSFTLEIQGGKKGLLVNSTNLCTKTNRALAHFTGQNGKVHGFKPVLKAQCGKGNRHKRSSTRQSLHSPR